MTQNLNQPLTLPVIYERVIKGDHPLTITLLALFVVCYAFDEALGVALGLDQYTIAAFAGLTMAGTALIIGIRDLFFRKWKLFYLRENEVIVAEQRGVLVVITDTAHIQAGALRSCTNPILVNTRPWVNHRIECFAASLRVAITASLFVEPADLQKTRRWLDIEVSELTSEIQACVTRVTARLGRGVVLESPDNFKVALEYEVNSRVLASLGVTCRLAAVQVVDHHTVGVVKQ